MSIKRCFSHAWGRGRRPGDGGTGLARSTGLAHPERWDTWLSGKQACAIENTVRGDIVPLLLYSFAQSA